MQLLVNPTSYTNALELIKLGAHIIYVDDKRWSVRNACFLDLKQIEELTKNKQQTKIYVLLNRFYFEPELDGLTKYLQDLSKLAIDGIIFSDFAINQICYEQNMKIKLIYHPETLVTNYGQFPFYLKNNISEVSLARELNKKEITEICKHKENMSVQMQVAGFAYMLHSRWKLLTNFQHSQNHVENLTNKKLLLRETSRKQPYIIYEDDFGTHLLTNYSLYLLKELNELHTLGVDTIRIDSFFHDEQWTIETTKVYLQAIKLIELNQWNKASVHLIHHDEITSCGFYHMDKKDLIYLDKLGEYE